MQYILEHSDLIFLFFTVPFFGWGLYKIFEASVIKTVLLIALILLLPILTGYTYVLANLYLILIYLALACGQYFLIKRYQKLYTTVIVPSMVLFPVLGVVAFVGAFYGSVSIDKEWDIKNYKIQYVREQGFSGHALMRYELYKFATPIFIKHIETKVDLDTTNNCIIKFDYKDFSFDKCSFTN